MNIHLFIGNISLIYVEKTLKISLKGINALLQSFSDASSIVFIGSSSPFCFFIIKFLWLWSCFFSHIVKYLSGNMKAVDPLSDYVWLQCNSYNSYRAFPVVVLLVEVIRTNCKLLFIFFTRKFYKHKKHKK